MNKYDIVNLIFAIAILLNSINILTIHRTFKKLNRKLDNLESRILALLKESEEEKTETQEAIAKAKALQDFCDSQTTCEACTFRDCISEEETWCGLNYPKTWVTPEAKIYKEAAESFYSGLIEGLKGTDGSEENE